MADVDLQRLREVAEDAIDASARDGVVRDICRCPEQALKLLDRIDALSASRYDQMQEDIRRAVRRHLDELLKGDAVVREMSRRRARQRDAVMAVRRERAEAHARLMAQGGAHG